MTNSPSAVWPLGTEQLGQRVHVYDCLDSTNTHALTYADDPAQHGLVILAHEQTAGRGQYGRSWHAPPGSSVLLSLLLFPPEALRRPVVLTAWAAVSVCETIHALTGLSATIKWPNDVLLHGKKICGILIEQRTTGNAEFPLASVVGIGLNVTQSAAMFADAGLPDACSLAMQSGRSFTFEEVARLLVQELDDQFAQLVAGDLHALESTWRQRLGVFGQSVIVEGLLETFHAHLHNLDFTALTMESASGAVIHLKPESVKGIHVVAS